MRIEIRNEELLQILRWRYNISDNQGVEFSIYCREYFTGECGYITKDAGSVPLEGVSIHLGPAPVGCELHGTVKEEDGG